MKRDTSSGSESDDNLLSDAEREIDTRNNDKKQSLGIRL